MRALFIFCEAAAQYDGARFIFTSKTPEEIDDGTLRFLVKVGKSPF